MPVLALDIGGANIKVADGLGYARSWPFALWKYPEQLAGKIVECLAAAPAADRLAVTMTGELCDCFATKRTGVQAIVASTVAAAGDTSVSFYQTTGEFVSAAHATDNHILTAASNWHALATFAGQYCQAPHALLIDIGSTTTDIIPIVGSREAARGRIDPDRLASGELVYTGVRRSPVCALLSGLRWRGTRCPVAQELFATTGDAYLLLDDIPEHPADNDTADGQPFTSVAAHARLARMIGGDAELVTLDEARSFARQVREAQVTLLAMQGLQVIDNMAGVPQCVVVSGQGEFLAKRLLERAEFSGQVISLQERLGPELSRSATAHALANLAREQL